MFTENVLMTSNMHISGTDRVFEAAENLNIQSLKITLEKKKEITIFQNQVSAEDDKNNQLCSIEDSNKTMNLTSRIYS